MKIKIEDAKQKLAAAYRSIGADEKYIDWLVELSITQDLTGNFFSGFSESAEGVYKGYDPSLVETTEVNKPSLKVINGNGRLAKLIIKDIFYETARNAHEQGQVLVAFKNTGYHGNMGTIARKFAEVDLICVYSANGGPGGVVAYGGREDIFGTNPIAYAIPTYSDPIVFDAATAVRAYGTIQRARDNGDKLPPNMYMDKDGNYTTDPNTAISMIPFGEYKGYAFNLLLDVLTGAMVGAKSGKLFKDENDVGAILWVIDPAAFGPLEEFKKQTQKLFDDIASSLPADGHDRVIVPGQHANEKMQTQLDSGYIDVDDKVWEKFEKSYLKTPNS